MLFKRLQTISPYFTSLFFTFLFPFAFQSDPLLPGALSCVLAWFTWVPLLLNIQKQNSPKSVFWLTYKVMFLANSGVFFWIINAMKIYGHMSWGLSLVIMVLMVGTLALYPSFALMIAFKCRLKAPFLFLSALSLTTFEWLLTWFPLDGHPWAMPVYALYEDLWLLQHLNWMGPLGITFLIYLINAMIVGCISSPKGAKKIKMGSTAAGVLVLLHVSGALMFLRKTDATSSLAVGVVQGNIGQDKKWSKDFTNFTQEKYKTLTLDLLSKSHLDLVVWPEASIPVTHPDPPDTVRFDTSYLGSALLHFGGPSFSSGERKTKYFNSTYLTQSSGEILQKYNKRLLVPFGEYVPFSDILPTSKWVPAVAGNFSKGIASATFSYNTLSYANLVCYESLFSVFASTAIREGATFFVNITNDAWFDFTSGPYQHFQFGRFRAIENQRPFVRAANTGISGAFDEKGNLLTQTSLFKDAAISVTLHPQTHLTFYTRFPFFIPLLLLCLWIFTLCNGWSIKRRWV